MLISMMIHVFTLLINSAVETTAEVSYMWRNVHHRVNREYNRTH